MLDSSIRLNKQPLLALVLPCYNEEFVLPETSSRLKALVQNLIDEHAIDKQSKIYFIDDGSIDATWIVIKKLCSENHLFAGLKLAHNKGNETALYAGLIELYSYFDAIITLDADLQDNISAIPQFIEEYKKGNDIVYGVRSSRKKDSFLKRTTALAYYWFMLELGVQLIPDHTNYRLMSKKAIANLAQYKESNLFLRGIVPSIGLPHSIVYYEREKRIAGETKYSAGRLIALAVSSIVSFSNKPLKLIRNIGVLFFLISMGMLGYILYSKFVVKTIIEGWSSLMLSVWFVGGTVITCLGIIGEYIDKIFTEVKNRPRYFIEEEIDKKQDI